LFLIRNFEVVFLLKKLNYMIKLQIIGHLGKDVVVNNVNGKTVMNFTVAHTEKYKDAQGVMKDKTTWVECAYWSDRTAVAQYLTKGKLVYTEGTPDVRTYTTTDGRNGASLSLRVQTVQLLGGSGNAEMGGGSPSNNNYNNSAPAASAAPVQTQSMNANELTEPIDDLPF
jgi:single-strand DNA-binding protein